jgi:lipoyl(octanoyl) transferase
MEKCVIYRPGITKFQKAWDFQNKLAEEIAEGNQLPTLILLEHFHTYTFGQQGKAENLLWNKTQIKDNNIDIHWIDRGGDVTYHGPGQLVGYPILPLIKGDVKIDSETGKIYFPPRDYVGYLRKLEMVIIMTLASFGIVSGQMRGQTGVWVQPSVLSRCKNCPPALMNAPAKIASIGVRVDVKGISRHGFALNVNPDMRYWDGILACGLENQNKISLANLLEEPPEMEIVEEKLISFFLSVFDFQAVSQNEEVL